MSTIIQIIIILVIIVLPIWGAKGCYEIMEEEGKKKENKKMTYKDAIKEMKSLSPSKEAINIILGNIDALVDINRQQEREIKRKETRINEAKKWIENTMKDRCGCNLGDLRLLLDILEGD